MDTRGKIVLIGILSGMLLGGCGALPAEVASAQTPALSPAQSATPILPTMLPDQTPQVQTVSDTPVAAVPTIVILPATPISTPSPRPSPTLAPGWTEVAVPGDSYALRIPPTWLRLPLEGQNPSSVLVQIGQSDPLLAGSLQHSLPEGVSNTLSLIAFDSLAASGDAAFVSAIRIGAAPFASYEEAATFRDQALANDQAATLVSNIPIKVGFEARSGRQLRYTTTFPPDAPQVTTHHTEIYLDNGRGKVLVIMFSTEGALQEGYDRLFEWVLDTVYFSL